MQIQKIFEKIENFKHVNKVLVGTGLFAFISGFALVHFDNQRLALEAQRSKNKDGSLLMALSKPSNLPGVKDWLVEISKLYIRGLWLTKINYVDSRNELVLSIRAMDQTDIYKYSSQLSGILRGKKFCLLEADVVKRGEKATTQNAKRGNKPVPFVLAFMAKKREAQEKKEVEKDAIKENPEEELRWVYNYEADFKYGNCF